MHKGKLLIYEWSPERFPGDVKVASVPSLTKLKPMTANPALYLSVSVFGVLVV
jgi:hypothetical protein